MQRLRLVLLIAAALAAAGLASSRLIHRAHGPAASETELRDTLAWSPLSTEHLEALAYRRHRAGDAERGAQLLAFAASLDLHNLSARFAVLRAALVQNDTAEAARAADQLMRMRETERLAPLLSRMMFDPAFTRALAKEAAHGAPWLAAFFSFPSRSDAQGLLDFAQALAEAGMSVPQAAQLALYDRLVAADAPGLAYAAWRADASAEDAGQMLRNRDFTRMPDGSPFDWQVRAGGAADAEFGAAAPDKRRGLRLTLLQARHSEPLLRQLVFLPPGRWRLSAALRIDRLTAYEGFSLSLKCAAGSHAWLGHSPALSVAPQWTELNAVFDVPADSCPAQWLQLGIKFSAPERSEAFGVLYLSGVTLTPAP